MNINKFRPVLIAYRRWIAAGLVAVAISMMFGAVRSESKFQIVTATRAIEAGSVIEARDVKLAPINFVWRSAVVKPSLVVGTRAIRNLEQDEPVSQSDVFTKKFLDPKNPSAVAITLAKNASASDLQTGDRVDVYALAQNGLVNRVFRNALVINQHTPKSLTDTGATISLAVQAEQVAKIAAYDDAAQLTFVRLAVG